MRARGLPQLLVALGALGASAEVRADVRPRPAPRPAPAVPASPVTEGEPAVAPEPGPVPAPVGEPALLGLPDAATARLLLDLALRSRGPTPGEGAEPPAVTLSYLVEKAALLGELDAAAAQLKDLAERLLAAGTWSRLERDAVHAARLQVEVVAAEHGARRDRLARDLGVSAAEVPPLPRRAEGAGPGTELATLAGSLATYETEVLPLLGARLRALVAAQGRRDVGQAAVLEARLASLEARLAELELARRLSRLAGSP